MAKTASLPFKGSFSHTQGFGARPSVYAKYGLAGHDGDDWVMPERTPLFSPIGGKVIRHGNDTSGWGIYIHVWDPIQKLLINIGHCSGLQAITGATVLHGQQIAFSGNTGFSEAPHVHVAAADTDDSGNRINTNNGYKGWYSILDTAKIQLVPLPDSPTPISSEEETPLERPEALKKTYNLIQGFNDMSLVEINNITAIGRPDVLAGFLDVDQNQRLVGGQSLSAEGFPVNYYPNSSEWVGFEKLVGLTAVPELPTLTLPQQSGGFWNRSSQDEYDRGVPGVYVRLAGEFFRTTKSNPNVRVIEGETEEVNIGDREDAEYGSRGQYEAVFYQDSYFKGPVLGKLGTDDPLKTRGGGISSFLTGASPLEQVIVPETTPAEEGMSEPVEEPTSESQPSSNLPPEESGEAQESVPATSTDIILPLLNEILGIVKGIQSKVESGVATPSVSEPSEEEANAFFFVDSDPPRASIYIDDQFQFDYTPSNLTYRIAPGEHKLTLKKKGYKLHEEVFNLAAGETFRKTIELQLSS